MTEPIELLLQSPASVALLAALEHEHRSDVGRFEPIADTDPTAVAQAANWLRSASLPDLIRRILRSAEEWAGPWNSSSSFMLPAAYSSRRVDLASALADDFTALLRAPIDRDAQEFWTSRYAHERSRLDHMPTDLHRVYCCGEFPIDGTWTTTAPHPSTHDSLTTAWELDVSGVLDVLRWRVPILPGARVYEIHEPSDWSRLIDCHPMVPTPPHSGWELPGPNHETMTEIDPRPSAIGWAPFGKRAGTTGPGPVESASGGHAARSGVRVAMPDWASIARDYDGVHLSWFGMLTCEGHVIDLPELGPDVVTMLRYWFSERTLWLNPVFGEPEPLPSPFPSDD